MDLSVVIPCHNEAENVLRLRSDLYPVLVDLSRSLSVEMVLVDDGSTDNTWQMMQDTFSGASPVNVRFARHEMNRGLGAALRTGFAAACGETVVTADSDGTYRFSQIPAVLDMLAPDADIVTASPYHPAGGVMNVPPHRLLLSKGSSMIYRLLVDQRIHTYTCLFRAYRRSVIEQTPFQADGFLAGTELMVKAMLAGFQVVEFPATLHVRAAGTSKAKLVRTILAHLRFQLRILGHRLGMISLVESMKVNPGEA
jgi:dolichol-phosphate mannosyltransferase